MKVKTEKIKRTAACSILNSDIIKPPIKVKSETRSSEYVPASYTVPRDLEESSK